MVNSVINLKSNLSYFDINITNLTKKRKTQLKYLLK